jgi:hypothetical protein
MKTNSKAGEDIVWAVGRDVSRTLWLAVDRVVDRAVDWAFDREARRR